MQLSPAQILVLDMDADYGDQLGTALRRQFREWTVTVAADPNQLPADWSDHTRLCLYPPRQFPDLETKSGSGAGGKPLQWLPMPDQAASLGDVYRYMPLSQLLPAIRSRLPAQPAADWSGPAGHAMPDPDDAPKRNKQEIGMILGLDHAGSADWTRHKIRTLLQSGVQVLYLPLMPTYNMTLLAPPGHGANLSTLLLRLANDDEVNVQDLGHCLQPHPDGFLQFRPPERSDDLLLCQADVLRRLVSLLRERVLLSDEPTVALVDCRALTLQVVCNLAVLCNFLAVRLPEGNSFAAQAGRREVAMLLARLAPTCRIEEIPSIIPERINDRIRRELPA